MISLIEVSFGLSHKQALKLAKSISRKLAPVTGVGLTPIPGDSGECWQVVFFACDMIHVISSVDDYHYYLGVYKS
jgi:hypothetical protein